MGKQFWYNGERQRIEFLFDPAALNGAPTEPVKATIVDPDGTKAVDGSNATADGQDSLGRYRYYYDYTAAKVGKHKVKAVSADGAVETDTFEISPDPTA